MPDLEREDGVLVVAGVVVGRALARQHREVRVAAEGLVEGRERLGCGRGVAPLVLQPPRRDLRVGLAVDPAGLAIALPERAVVDEVAVVAEGVSTRGIVSARRYSTSS